MKDNRAKGNQQPIPIEVFNEAIISYIDSDKFNYNDLIPKILTYNSGKNSAEKILVAIRASLKNKTVLNKAIRKIFSVESYNKLSTKEKNYIIVAIISLKYPFVYEMLFAFAKLFNLQDTVNKKYISDTLASKFGSNLSLEHAIGANLKTLVDAGMLKRVKQGLYSKIEPIEVCDFVKEAWIYTWFELNGRKTVPVEELRYEPFISYLIDTNIDWRNSKLLLTRQDFCNQTWIESVK
jgi:hypothetical protein